MNPIAILEIIAMVLTGIDKGTELVIALKKQIDNKIPDDQLRLESYDDTVARLKADGTIPADWQPPAI